MLGLVSPRRKGALRHITSYFSFQTKLNDSRMGYLESQGSESWAHMLELVLRVSVPGE